MPELLKALLVSASLGALLGLERQWSEEREHPAEESMAGSRTFAVWAALGTLCAWFAREQHAAFFLAGFAGIVVVISIYLLKRSARDREGGLTTAAVGLAAYLIGGLAFMGQAKTAVVITIAMLLLLASKEHLHQLSRKFSNDDVRQALQFAAITGIVLPLVPDYPLGPYGAFNPYTIWLMVVLVSGLGFVGYVAMRVFGDGRGLAVAGLLGGLASSTATTLAMSRQSRAQPEYARLCALAAWAV
ncbi:MAG: MgtC/SapB family protein [Chthoniobacterales bacterium]|nr:MgtC/SapB family protein [Chthoniobacterales bacterium]